MRSSTPKIAVCLGLASALSASATLNVTPNGSANDLADAIVGAGITINNATYTGAAAASGTFSGGLAAGLGINSGIVLTTGLASHAGERNTFDDRTGGNNVAGSSILDALVTPLATQDATILTLEFTLIAGGDLFFNYVFASEEYNEFAGSSFNDVFGFFLDGTDISDNVALIPGTSTPVAINNVNANVNSAFFRDNDPGSDSASASGNERPVDPLLAPLPELQYDGLTKVLTVSAKGIGAGSHTITLAIADTNDSILDSAVFIQAGTFSTIQQPVVPESSTVLGGLGLAAAVATVIHRRRQASR